MNSTIQINTGNAPTYPLCVNLDPNEWVLQPKETKRVGNKTRTVSRITYANGRRISFQLNAGKHDKLVAPFGVDVVKDNGITRELAVQLPPDHDLV